MLANHFRLKYLALILPEYNVMSDSIIHLDKPFVIIIFSLFNVASRRLDYIMAGMIIKWKDCGSAICLTKDTNPVSSTYDDAQCLHNAWTKIL
jgi:hypothetical protein